MSAELTVDAPVVPYAMSHEPARMVRAEGFDYDHEVLIALPPSYHTSPEKDFPVLWVTDGALLMDLAVGILNVNAAGRRLPEMIVVGVGHPSAEGVAGLTMKRNIDFLPPGVPATGDKVAEGYLRRVSEQAGVDYDPDALLTEVKADRFLAFLVDQLRPSLASEYRMADDHVLFGHSGGAMFAGYALFARPGGFARYVLGSCIHPVTLDMEDAYARSHDDLTAKVFFSAADLEANNLGLAAARAVSRTTLLAENLLMRQYPSLELKTRIYTDTDHYDIIPRTLGDGLRFVFAREAAELAAKASR